MSMMRFAVSAPTTKAHPGNSFALRLSGGDRSEAHSIGTAAGEGGKMFVFVMLIKNADPCGTASRKSVSRPASFPK